MDAAYATAADPAQATAADPAYATAADPAQAAAMDAAYATAADPAQAAAIDAAQVACVSRDDQGAAVAGRNLEAEDFHDVICRQFRHLVTAVGLGEVNVGSVHAGISVCRQTGDWATQVDQRIPR